MQSLFLGIQRFLRLFGVNRAVFFGVLSKLWFAGAGIVTIFLIVNYFTPEVQGYYFTFYSLLALQVFVELGLTVVIINFTSHEWAHLGFDGKGGIVGDSDALSRLKSLAKVVFRWYAAGGAILAFGLGIAGYLFFSYSHQVAGVNWAAPWLMLCLLTGVNLGILPAFSLLEGSNQVSQVYFYRFTQEVLRSVSTWAIIVFGGRLWAPAGSTFIMLIWAFAFLGARYFNYFKTLFLPSYGPQMNWREEVWPMQWRIAVTWLSGYFIFSFFTPVLFHYQGPVIAGQMGMTWNVVQAITTIASMWLIVRVPQFGMLVSRKDYKSLNRVLLHSAIVSVGVACCGAAVVFGLISILYANGHVFAQRFLPPLPTALLLVASILMLISSVQALYLRAHKKEPFMVMSVITSFLMAVSVLVAADRWGALGIAAAYLCVVAFFVIPCGTIIWLRCRNEWQYKNLVDPGVMA